MLATRAANSSAAPAAVRSSVAAKSVRIRRTNVVELELARVCSLARIWTRSAADGAARNVQLERAKPLQNEQQQSNFRESIFRHLATIQNISSDISTQCKTMTTNDDQAGHSIIISALNRRSSANLFRGIWQIFTPRKSNEIALEKYPISQSKSHQASSWHPQQLIAIIRAIGIRAIETRVHFDRFLSRLAMCRLLSIIVAVVVVVVVCAREMREGCRFEGDTEQRCQHTIDLLRARVIISLVVHNAPTRRDCAIWNDETPEQFGAMRTVRATRANKTSARRQTTPSAVTCFDRKNNTSRVSFSIRLRVSIV